MKKEQFLEFMRQPDRLDQKSGKMLEAITMEFPYFQTAQILYLKALHNEKNIHYHNRLKIAAAYSADRRVLYKFIMQPELKAKIDKIEQDLQEPKAEQAQINNSTSLVNEIKAEEKTLLQASLRQENKQKKSEEISEEKPKKETEVKKTEKEPKVNNPAEEKVSQTKEKDFSEFIAEDKNKKEEATENSNTDKEPATLAESFEQASSNVIAENTKEQETSLESDKVSISANTPTTSGNLDEQDDYEKDKGISELETEVLKEAILASIESDLTKIPEIENKKATQTSSSASTSKEEKYTFSQWMKTLSEKKEIKNEVKINPAEPSSDLIEKFIQEEPKIKPKKAAFFSPVNLARMSVVENDSFVTETLAKVYASQGNYTKAIKAYENLILKYPEKSAYFATLIQEIKEK